MKFTGRENVRVYDESHNMRQQPLADVASWQRMIWIDCELDARDRRGKRDDIGGTKCQRILTAIGAFRR
jgi:hypothetical protein